MAHGPDPLRGACEAEFGGERILLLPDRAVFRCANGDLIVADVHLGKGATMRRAGIPLPPGSTQWDVDRLVSLVRALRPRRLVVLGDLWHTSTEVDTPAGDRTRSALDVIASLGSKALLIAGNHDRRAGFEDLAWNLEIATEVVREGSLAYAHEPPRERTDVPTLAGHVHPSARIRTGRDRMTLPAFWQRDGALVLPAYGAFTGAYPICHLPRDAMWLVTPDRVFPWLAERRTD